MGAAGEGPERKIDLPYIMTLGPYEPSAREVLDAYTDAIFRDTWRCVAMSGATWRHVAISVAMWRPNPEARETAARTVKP